MALKSIFLNFRFASGILLVVVQQPYLLFYLNKNSQTLLVLHFHHQVDFLGNYITCYHHQVDFLGNYITRYHHQVDFLGNYITCYYDQVNFLANYVTCYHYQWTS